MKIAFAQIVQRVKAFNIYIRQLHIILIELCSLYRYAYNPTDEKKRTELQMNVLHMKAIRMNENGEKSEHFTVLALYIFVYA